MGSLVRTNRHELGLVVQTSPGEPLHPVVSSGVYERHITHTLPVPEGLDVRGMLAA